MALSALPSSMLSVLISVLVSALVSLWASEPLDVELTTCVSGDGSGLSGRTQSFLRCGLVAGVSAVASLSLLASLLSPLGGVSIASPADGCSGRTQRLLVPVLEGGFKLLSVSVAALTTLAKTVVSC